MEREFEIHEITYTEDSRFVRFKFKDKIWTYSVMSGFPIKSGGISEDDILNLKITLETNDVNEFINKLGQ